MRPATRKDFKEILDLAQEMHPFDRRLFTSDVKSYIKMASELVRTRMYFMLSCNRMERRYSVM